MGFLSWLLCRCNEETTAAASDTGTYAFDYTLLEAVLRNWNNSGGREGPYDFGGMVGLLAACLDNLESSALEAELEDIGDGFTDRQKAFLKKIVERL